MYSTNTSTTTLHIFVSHRLLEDVVPGQDDGSVAALPVHHHAVHVGQLDGVEAGRPELALLQDQHPLPFPFPELHNRIRTTEV